MSAGHCIDPLFTSTRLHQLVIETLLPTFSVTFLGISDGLRVRHHPSVHHHRSAHRRRSRVRPRRRNVRRWVRSHVHRHRSRRATLHSSEWLRDHLHIHHHSWDASHRMRRHKMDRARSAVAYRAADESTIRRCAHRRPKRNRNRVIQNRNRATPTHRFSTPSSSHRATPWSLRHATAWNSAQYDSSSFRCRSAQMTLQPSRATLHCSMAE
jgi:hypothetical protein